MGDVEATQDVIDFIEELQQELRRDGLSLLDAPFLTALEAGALSNEQLRRWAEAFYGATRDGRLLIGNFYANSPNDPELRRELAENLYEEETGRISGVGKCHMDVFCEFLAAFGLTSTQTEALQSTVDANEARGRAISPADFYIELAAYGLSVEVPNAEFCQRVFDALYRTNRFAVDELRWFSMHAELDAHHGDEFQKYVTHVSREPDGLVRLRSATRELSSAVQYVWDGCNAWR